MPLKGFCANVFWWHEQGSFCPLINLSTFQGQPVILGTGNSIWREIDFFPLHVTSMLHLLDCMNENSLILSLFNPFGSLYRAQSMYIWNSMDRLSAQNKTEHRKSRIFLSGVIWDSKLQAIQERACLHHNVCRWLLMVKNRVLPFK